MQSIELIAYIEDVKSLAKQQWISANDYPKELTDWISWAERYADRINPLIKGLPSYKKATETLRLEDIK